MARMQKTFLENKEGVAGCVVKKMKVRSVSALGRVGKWEISWYVYKVINGNEYLIGTRDDEVFSVVTENGCLLIDKEIVWRDWRMNEVELKECIEEAEDCVLEQVEPAVEDEREESGDFEDVTDEDEE